jgi:hypothetical protein
VWIPQKTRHSDSESPQAFYQAQTQETRQGVTIQQSRCSWASKTDMADSEPALFKPPKGYSAPLAAFLSSSFAGEGQRSASFHISGND